MNEQLQTWLFQTLQQATAVLEKGAEFLGEQLPLVVQEFLFFYFWWSLMWVLIAIAVLVLWGIFVRRVALLEGSEPVGTWTVSLALVPTSLGVLFVNLYTVLLISLAPRVFLIKEFMDLTR